MTMAFLSTRQSVVNALALRVQNDVHVIVALATPCSLPLACWIADRLSLPLAYVRPGKSKAYGRQRQHEGADTEGLNVCLIADGDMSDVIPLLHAARVDLIEVAG